MDDKLAEWRKIIDELDGQMLSLLAKRVQVSSEIMNWKKKSGKPLLDQGRENVIIQKLRSRAQEFGLDPNLVQELYAHILKNSKEQ